MLVVGKASSCIVTCIIYLLASILFRLNVVVGETAYLVPHTSNKVSSKESRLGINERLCQIMWRVWRLIM